MWQRKKRRNKRRVVSDPGMIRFARDVIADSYEAAMTAVAAARLSMDATRPLASGQARVLIRGSRGSCFRPARRRRADSASRLSRFGRARSGDAAGLLARLWE